jgi:5-formyltetrahydrofolate cyclo-ligase
VHGTGTEDQEPGRAGFSDEPALSESAGTPGTAGTPEHPDESSPASELPSAWLNVPQSWQPNRAAGAGLAGAAGATGAAGLADVAGLTEAKAAMRASVLARRRAMSAEERATAGRTVRDAVLGLPEMQMAGTVAGYVSMGAEPETRGLLFALWKRGTYVLLPVLRADGDLDWASYEGPDSLAPGLRGMLEPTELRRGVTAITSADLVIVPALAVDRGGRRLGRGGGSYDRALARVGVSIMTVALLHEGELVEEVPAGEHDQPVRAAALPGEGICRLR